MSGTESQKIRFFNTGKQTLTHGGVTIPPGGSEPFNDICAFLTFVDGSGARIVEEAPGQVVDYFNKLGADANCGVTIKGITVQPGNEQADESALGPGESDSAKRLGAQEPEPDGVVDAPSPDPAEDDRQPTQQLHDAKNPRTEGEIGDVDIDKGADSDQAADTVDRAKKGKPPKGEPDNTKGNDRAGSTPKGGDPVDLFDGSFTLGVTDLDVPSPFFLLRFERLYRSGTPTWGPLGFNWDHNWNVHLRPLNSGSIARANGYLHEDVFVTDDGVDFEPPRGVFEKMTRTGADAYETVGRGGIKMRFERPANWPDGETIPLRSISDRYDNSIVLDYDADGHLVRIRDDDGRGFDLVYGDCGLLEAVLDHTGRRVTYIHDDDATHLVRVVAPHDAAVDDPFAVTEYEYSWLADHRAQRHNIIRVLDGNGDVVVTNLYGEDPTAWTWNRVVEQWQGPFCWRFDYRQIQWLAAIDEHVNEIMWQTDVVEPDGTLKNYGFNFRGNLIDERFRLSIDGSYRVVSSSLVYDEQGNLAQRRNPDGSGTRWRYDHTNPDPRLRGTLLSVELRPPAGVPVASRITNRFRYEPNFQLPIEEIDEGGARTVHHYDPQGGLVRTEWPDVTLPDGTVESAASTFELSARGQVTATITPEGVRNEIQYVDTGGTLDGMPLRLERDVGGVGEVQTFEWTPEGWLASRVDGNTNATDFEYDRRGRTTRVVLPAVDGARSSWSYRLGPNGQIVEIARPAGEFGGVTGDVIADVIERNGLGQPTATVVGANTATPARTTLSLDHRGSVVLERAPSGEVTERCFDERGLLLVEKITATDTEPLESRRVYDRSGRASAVVRFGQRADHTFDVWGRVLTRSAPDGSTVSFGYGPSDTVTSMVVEGDPGDGGARRVLRRVEVDHDERGRPVRSRIDVFTDDPNAGQTLEAVSWFDHDDRRVRHVGPTGATTQVAHDGLDRPIALTDPVGNITEFDYGPAQSSLTVTSRETGVRGPVVSWATQEFDARGRRTRTVNSAGSASSWVYDDRDLVVEATDPIGVTTTFVHDLFGNIMARSIDAGGLAVSDSYLRDRNGLLVGYQDPAGVVSTIDRDELGREVGVSIGGVYRSERVHDGSGRIVRRINPDGSEVSYARDQAGRVVRMVVTAGPGLASVEPHSYRYDGLGRLVEAAAGAEVVRWKYDSLDRIVEEQGPAGAFKRVFDDSASAASTIWPTGRVELAHWDPIGRVERIDLASPDTVLASGNPGDVLATLGFLGLTKVGELRFGTGATTTTTYDDAGRVVEMEIADSAGTDTQTRYAYDRLAQRLLDTDTALPPLSRLFSHRSTGELTAVAEGVPALVVAPAGQAAQDAAVAAAQAGQPTLERAFDLDDAGVRTSATVTPQGGASTVTNLQRGPAHRLDAIDGAPVAHDLAGRRLTDPDHAFTYDALGRVTAIAGPGATATVFAYDPAGRLASTATNGTAVRHLHLGGLHLADNDDTGFPILHRTLHPGVITAIAETTAAGVRGLHHDPHFDLVAVSGPDGVLLERYRYGVFGQLTVHDPVTGVPRLAPTAGVRPTFGAMRRIPGTSLYWTPARLYDPSTGLFCAVDPRGLAGASDPYVFCNHSPLVHLDPEGEIAPLVVFGIMAGVGALLGGGAAWWSGGDFWDIAAGATIGGIVGGLGGWMFSAAASAGTAGIGSLLGGTALANTTLGGYIASIGGGAFGGLVSGTAGGAISGAGHGAWGAYRTDGDIAGTAWDMAKREAFAGGVSGTLTGGMFGGLMRTGAIPAGLAPPGQTARGGMAAFRDVSVSATQQVSRRSAMMRGVMGRGFISPWGLGGAAGTGYVGGYSAQVTRDIYDGRDAGDAFLDSWDEGLEGAALNMAGQSVHPITHRYWKTRFSLPELNEIQARRVGRVKFEGTTARHHQRNVAQYPEFAHPVPRSGEVQPLMTRLANAFSRGNVTGRHSEYQTRAQHIEWHEAWRTSDMPDSLGWTRVPTHGPFTPAWNPYLPQVDSDPQESDAPEKRPR